MEQELATIKSNSLTLSASDIRKQVNLIQEVMEAVMKGPTKDAAGKDIPGIHYGVIPGCKLPSLYKAGAEKLAMTFRLGAEYEELPGSSESDSFICYKINCKLFYIPTGNIVGNGRGVCNSKEKKFRTRMVYANKATEEEKVIGKEEERTGDKGKFKVYIVPQDPWDIQNTLYKIACKRAMIAAIINATGASDIFSQDVEDLPEGTVIEDAQTAPTAGKPSITQPQEKKPEPTKSELKPDHKAINPISEAQRKRLYAIRKSVNYPDQDFKEWLFFTHNTDDQNIEREIYDAVVIHVQGWKPNANA